MLLTKRPCEGLVGEEETSNDNDNNNSSLKKNWIIAATARTVDSTVKNYECTYQSFNNNDIGYGFWQIELTRHR
ncbi:hypothetical protein GYH30_033426 [Glycine max]|nr:hypothetical protein GYH30_033426 [Glycine max]